MKTYNGDEPLGGEKPAESRPSRPNLQPNQPPATHPGEWTPEEWRQHSMRNRRLRHRGGRP